MPTNKIHLPKNLKMDIIGIAIIIKGVITELPKIGQMF
jgi:hypothetical protein